MLPADPAVRALLLFLNVAPIALYFLFLGLVNSHARPCRVSSRADFVALTSVVVPILFWPMPALIVSGLWWLLVIEVAAATWGFLHLLPRRHGGWVIYNISEGRWRSAWESAARRAGLEGRWDGATWRNQQGDVAVHYSSLALLRNVSVEITSNRRGAGITDEIERHLDKQFSRMEQLPSATGACLWVLGISLMILPLWIVGHHLPAMASALARLLG